MSHDHTHYANGGCHCGRTKFTVRGEAVWIGYCHCTDCRRVTGAPVAMFVCFAPDQIEHTGERPAVYQSSENVQREFCTACGSSISYINDDLPNKIYLTIGAFDEPGYFAPEAHAYASSQLPWLHLSDHLPRFSRGPSYSNDLT